MGLRGPELLLIFTALFVLFGGSTLPQLGQSLGLTLKSLRDALSGAKDDAP